MGLSGIIVLLAISLHLVLGGGETFSSKEDKIIDNLAKEELEESNRAARHVVDGYGGFGGYGNYGGYGGYKSGYGAVKTSHSHYGPAGYNPQPQQPQSKAGIMSKISGWFTPNKAYTPNIRQIPPAGSCRQPLPLPQNVLYECRDTSCKVSCPANFIFPGGPSQLNVVCVSGKWIVRDSTIEDLIPPCTPNCVPPCQNNGICLEPGLCQCPENFYGALCQNRNLQCASKPPIPNGSKVSCRNNNCNVECMKGYQFPDGTGITNLECLDGEWHHPKSGNPKAPDCQPICNPQCENGGKCISINMCQCKANHRGPQCQYDLQVCNVTKSGFNGNYKCSFGVNEASCTLTCPGGIALSGPKVSTYNCQYNTGEFSPPIPSCLYPKGYKVVSSKKTSSLQVVPGKGYYNYKEDHNSSSEVKTSLEFVPTWKEHKKYSEFFSSSEEYIEAPSIYSLYFEEDLNMIIDRSPKPALCATWSGINLKTFDGTIFKAPLSCSHTLVSDKIDGTFDIILKACPYGSGYNCPHSLKIYWQSVEYTFENSNGTVKLSTPQKNLPIPVQVKGMKVLPVAQHLRIDLDPVGMTLLWDKAQYIAMQATPGLWNRTGGMCGSFDGDHRNDFISKDGVLLKTSKAFADSWKESDDSTLCIMDNSGEVDFTKQCDQKDRLKAIEVCEQLLENSKLTECVKPFNMNALMKSCVNDYCNCANKDHPEMCNCDSVAMLAKECEFRGIKLEHGWRDLQICPIQCSFGRIYQPCGPNLEPTCGSDVIPNKDKCNEGCFCPEGTVQYKDSCISPELCPCTMRNKEFKAGSTITKDCNTCSCENGVWKCTDENCGARCSAVGDPHYTTFDGKKFDFMGKCSYYMLKTDNITVEAENVPCDGAISDNPAANSLETPSCTKSLTIISDINGVKTTIKLGQNLVTHVNDKEVLKFPKITGNDQILIRQASSTFITVDFTDGISVWWDGQNQVYIDAPPSLREKTSGLCGTFNSKTQDDFLTPEGDIETAVEPFANKWRTKDTCDDQTVDEPGPHPCTANPHMREVAEKHCAWLTDDIFLDCQWSVEPETYYENCIYDTCACKEDPSKCFCPILSAYATECTRQGIKTGWRYTVKECAIQCPVGQVYEECGDSCTRTCDDVATKNTCQKHCIEGCRCPKGEYLNEKNECVPAKDCPCVYDGMTFNTGYKEVRPGRQFLELCTCEGGLWNCDMAEAGDSEKYPPSSELKSQCANKPNAEFSKCVPTEPKTCKNMDTYVEDLEDCTPGCACMEGFVYDTTTKECLKADDCPCHHGGKSYSGGDKITEDCNICLCQSGNWKCTTNECERTCSVWGDSHFTTFDNHEFDFQGACDYILSKGVAANGDSYSITIQNVLCGTLGVTCSKSLQVTLDGSINDSITLSADSSYLDDQSKSSIDKLREELGSKGHSYNIYKAGLFTVIEIIPLKLQIKWDEGTRVYVKLGKDWKGRVNGLCGNYNDNANDDMKTPSQGLETSPFLFGHSWKMQEFCVAPIQQIDACKEHPQRETWAQLKCGILKSSMFKECHSEVPVEKYLKRCIFDTCACDQGGDCECLCTAIAAYAHSCSAKGINIRWRTQHFCPMQCDPHCSEYKPCTPACAVETCDNFLDQGITDRMCLNENCIEGCQIKPCDEGMIYLNDSFTKCVPKSECKPVCMLKDGKTFYEGDVTFVDDCQTCRCTKKKEVCSGVPCAKQLTTTQSSLIEIASSTVIPQQTQEESKCISGWTRWINNDENSNNNERNLKLNDEEKLPKYDRFEIIYGTCEKKFMKKIECRVVDSHEKAELMDENVYCTLEDGLVCNGNCHDYEIRVFCRCGSEEIEEVLTEPQTPAKLIDLGKACNATIEEYKEYPGDCFKFLQCLPKFDGTWDYVEKTCGPSMMFNPVFHVCDHIASVQAIKPMCGEKVETTEPTTVAVCPPGKVWSECSNHCEHTCHYFGHKLSKRGLCNPGDLCKPGCVDETEPNCPGLNKMWRDKDTCVEIDECPCMSSDEKYVKPHSVYQQNVSGSVETCQCIDNTYFCKGIVEPIEITTKLPEIVNLHSEPSTEEPLFIIPTSSTPPLRCDPELLIPMINGAEPLPDSVFAASSTLSDSYLPHFGRLHTQPSTTSKGSWSPLISDQMQYLQVSFDEPQPLFGVIMQGSPVSDQHVTLFKILYSNDGEAFHYLVDETDKPQMFNGPIDSRTPVESLFKIPIEAKTVRIYPLKWHGAKIAMRVELLGCGKEAEKSSTMERLVATTEAPEIFTTTVQTIACQDCRDPMGVDSGAMHRSQVKASSIWPRPLKAKKVHLIDMLKLSAKASWRPALNTPSEYLEFDFLEPRNISGLITKGGPEGWVSGFKAMYSQNGFVWNNVLTADGRPRIFIANHDRDTPQTNFFRFPIQTQMLKVVPLKWKKNINMRVEPLGCFSPYPEVKESIEIVESKPVKCPICDNIIVSPDDSECKCKEPLMWDGNDCVDQNMCPCVENYLSYPIGSKFENKNCQECVCLLGGVKQCKRKKCPPCETGLRLMQTSTCICKCEPCPEMQKLCPSSGDCIPEALWCNGVKDCEDDEPAECTKIIEDIGIPTMETNTTTVKHCPEPECPEGMKMKIIEQSATREMSEIFKTTSVTKKFTTSHEGNKFIRTKSINVVEEYFEKPEFESGYNSVEECAEFVCTPEPTTSTVKNVSFSCTMPKCPDDYEVEIDNSKMKPGDCLKYTCILRPQKDRVCELSGKSFITFDGTDFKYDTCSHILARDLVNSSWYISVQLNCTENRKICRKILVIKDISSDATLTIMPNQKLKFNDFVYTTRQLAKSPKARSIFTISQPGNTILVVSHLHGFWAQYDEIGGIKIGVSEKFIKTVDGLCGYFNGNPADDKRFPNGTVTSSTNKFGDSWFDKDIPKDECYPQVCPKDMQMKALTLCNSIKHISFLKCNKAVNYKQFVSKCIETTCECLKANKDDTHSCKCSILQGFVKQCLAENPQIQLDTWRAVHQCEISCPPPLVHSDCYKRRCEPSCDNANGDDCPVLPDACFCGCYCPEGTLRQGDTCIPINECKDCICDAFGPSKYLTYDRKNFTFNGNCTYLLSRDIVLPGVHTFQVYVTMDDCKKLGRPSMGPNSSCAKSLHILHGEHIIHIQRAASNKSVQVLIDGMEVKKLPFKDTWLGITQTDGNELKLTLPESHVEVTSSFDDMAYSVRVPSIKYGSKMEGLCGDCNGDPDNDLRMNPAKRRPWKSTPSAVEVCDIVESWKADEPKLGLGEDECLSEDVAVNECIPPPPEKDPCFKFFDAELFGECNTIVEPLIYVSACQQDMCKPGNDQKGACNSLAAYARECSRNGVCLNWRSPDLCPYDCVSDMMYEPCGCLKTCDSIKATDIFEVENIRTKTVMNPKDDLECSAGKSEGCFCPPGKVMDNDKCIPEEQCIKCDDGIHAVGESWKKDKCTECTCHSNGKTECAVQQCPVTESICSEGFMPSKISSSEECCPKYICVPEPKVPTPVTCPDAPFPKCGAGQFKKQKIGSDGCPQFICECKPVSECEPFAESVPLKTGEKLVSDFSGCCPTQTIICDTNTCPEMVTSCSKKFYEAKIVTHLGDCCPSLVCSPPKDNCIVEIDGIETLKSLGDTWKAPEDPCIKNQCVYGPNDTTQVTKITEKCDTKCKKGYEYQRLDLTECCGSCVQTQCIFDEKLYPVGEQWFSDDNCTTFTCENNDGQLLVSSSKEVCADVSKCPPEQLEDVGCCKICKPVSESQKNCLPASLAESQTVGLVRINKFGSGMCVNKEPIQGFTECYGSCESGSKYNVESFGQDKMCFCCSIEAYKTILVTLICDDGYKVVKDIQIPSSCGCSACSDSQVPDYNSMIDIRMSGTDKGKAPIKRLIMN
ncbi:hemocytin [Episyrphus balteatus]|uniref:hemocytin n=1 Tax=Episyrphus balteatus TaxID=286459 RepID=UPI0024859DC5|nr:hemocytin [Episyrphus balteatus]